jgi:hypothetical protein
MSGEKRAQGIWRVRFCGTLSFSVLHVAAEERVQCWLHTQQSPFIFAKEAGMNRNWPLIAVLSPLCMVHPPVDTWLSSHWNEKAARVGDFWESNRSEKIVLVLIAYFGLWEGDLPLGAVTPSRWGKSQPALDEKDGKTLCLDWQHWTIKLALEMPIFGLWQSKQLASFDLSLCQDFCTSHSNTS